MVWTYRGPEARCPAPRGHGHELGLGEASSPPSQPSPPAPSPPRKSTLGGRDASPGGLASSSPGLGHPDDPGRRNLLVLVSDGSRETRSNFGQFEDAVSGSQVQNQTDRRFTLRSSFLLRWVRQNGTPEAQHIGDIGRTGKLG